MEVFELVDPLRLGCCCFDFLLQGVPPEMVVAARSAAVVSAWVAELGPDFEPAVERAAVERWSRYL